MTLAHAFIAYAVAWWMVIFMVAPVGAHKITDENRKKTWGLKLLATTVIAAFVTWGIDLVITSGVITVK